MTEKSTSPVAPVKRSDVGYGRPPIEKRFKPGQKPPPRKQKKELPELSGREILWRILQEERRILANGKVTWMRTSEIIIRKAYQLADGGNSTLQRLMSELLMRLSGEEDVAERMPSILLNQDENDFGVPRL
jgi:hypothetical protein